MAILLSQGTTVTMECAGDASPVEIDCVTSIDSPQGSRSEISVTCLTSTAQEFALGLVDNGTATINYNIDECSEGQAKLQDAATSDEPCEFVIEFPSGSTITFNALVQPTGVNISLDSAVTATASLRVTGDVTWNWACSS